MPKTLTKSQVEKYAKSTVTWARRKYDDDALYMVTETSEATEGYLSNNFPILLNASDATIRRIIKRAKQILVTLEK